MENKFRIIYGVGISDADYPVTSYIVDEDGVTRRITCPYYLRWCGIMQRACCPKFKKKRLNYSDCTIAEEWLRFSVFKAWMETQDWEGKELDKDLLVPGNKEYGPDTCIFVSKKVNSFMIERAASRGQWPIGVVQEKRTGKFIAQCHSVESNRQVVVGRFFTPEEAHEAWREYKLKQAKILAAEQTDERVAKILIARYENYGKTSEMLNTDYVNKCVREAHEKFTYKDILSDIGFVEARQVILADKTKTLIVKTNIETKEVSFSVHEIGNLTPKNCKTLLEALDIWNIGLI